MKRFFLYLVIFILSASYIHADEGFYGFGQAQTDSSNFSLPRLRVGFKTNSQYGWQGISVKYDTYADFVNGEFQLGFANAVFSTSIIWLPKLHVGRTLDPATYQFPSPFLLPIIGYPSTAFNIPCGNGIFLEEIYDKWWAMAGLTNGSGEFKDNNKSLDLTSRVTRDLAYGFNLGAIYRTGEQPDGLRRIAGVDFSWSSGSKVSVFDSIWVNCGYNKIDHIDQKQGWWIMSTIDFSKYVQMAGLYQRLKVNDIDYQDGWTVGLNLFITKSTVIRFDYIKPVAEDECWKILFQQIF